MHTDVAWQDSGSFSTITCTQTPTETLNIYTHSHKHMHAHVDAFIRHSIQIVECYRNWLQCSLSRLCFNLKYVPHIWSVTPHLYWGVPHTCCQGIPPPAWQRSSPPAGGWGVCPVGWPQGIHSHIWASAIPLSWWDEASGRTLWWSRALSIQKEGHTEHAQHHSLETQRGICVDRRHSRKARSKTEELDQSWESGVIIPLVLNCFPKTFST